MFRGTKKIGPAEFSKIIAMHGGNQNAFTSTDYTAYYQALPAKHLYISFKLEADRMQGLLLDPKDFKKELQVVMEERRMRVEDNPQMLTYERFYAMAHVASPYHHPVIGWMSDINQLNVQDVRQWYRKWYTPNNARVVVVGDVVPDKVYALAKRYFGGLKPKKLPLAKKRTPLMPLGRREVTVKRPAKLPLLIMGYNTPSLLSAHARWEPYALMVLSAVLSGGDSARLPKTLVRDQQVAKETDAYYSLYNRFDSLFTIQAIPAKNRLMSTLVQAIQQQITILQRELVSEEELNRIKQQVIADNVFKQDSLLCQAREIGSLETIGLSWRDADDFVSRISAVTSQQVQAVAKKYLSQDRLSVATLDPLPMKSGEVVYDGGHLGGVSSVH